MSGSTNAGEAFHLEASRRAAESTYAGIVRLVAAAQRSRAPMSRLADRYAMGFLAATVALAALAWLWSGDPIRAVAVLVVATPCPLILAVPVAIVSGLSRAAKHGILIKGGRALETLARVRALVIDKTGTLTLGRARIASIDAISDLPADELLRIAASLDQASKHIMAQTIAEAARSRGSSWRSQALSLKRRAKVSKGAWMAAAWSSVDALRRPKDSDRASPMARAAGGRRRSCGRDRWQVCGHPDPGRRVAGRYRGALADLRTLGIERIVLATGDRRDVAEMVARACRSTRSDQNSARTRRPWWSCPSARTARS